MAFYWGEQHETEFRARIRALSDQGDTAGVWQVFVTELDLCPDRFDYAIDMMLYALHNRLLEDGRMAHLVRLADYADAHCRDDDQRNEIHRLMVQICGSSENEAYRARARPYYMQLPLLRHSREVYAKYVLSDEAYTEQLKKTVLYTVDLAECAIRQMISPGMSDEERLYVYRRAAALWEAVLDGGFAGCYDVPLLCDYANMAMLLFDLGRVSEAEDYITKMLDMLDRLVDAEQQTPGAWLVSEPYPDGCTSPEISCMRLIRDVVDRAAFAKHREELLRLFRSLEPKATGQ